MKEVLEHDNGTLIGDTRCLKLNLPFAFMSTLYITFPEYLKHDNGGFMGHNKSRAENIIAEDGTHGPTTINPEKERDLLKEITAKVGIREAVR